MDSAQGLLLALSWFLLRFGVPILITGLFIFLFSRLDSRWKEQAIARRKELVQDQVIPLIKCWVFHDCPPEKREKCPAYQESQIPCWQVFRDPYGNLKDSCLGCEVFSSVPLPNIRN